MNLTLQAWSCVYNTSPPVFIIENGSIGFTSLKYVYIALLLFVCSSHVYIWLQSGKYKLCNKCTESKYSVYRANPNRVIIHRHLNCFCSFPFLHFGIFFLLLFFGCSLVLFGLWTSLEKCHELGYINLWPQMNLIIDCHWNIMILLPCLPS